MRVVGISAGHWLSDPGAVGNGVVENELTIRTFAPCLKALMEAGVFPVYTSGPLSNKISFLSQYPIEIAVEIHYNSTSASTAKGAEVIYYQGSVEGKRLARAIYDSLIGLPFIGNRGVKSAEEVGRPNLGFLKRLPVPSVIVEPMWISNPNDAAMLNNPQITDHIGIAVAEGILSFL